MLVGRLISVDGCEDSLEDIDEIEFARSEDEDEQQSWTQSRAGRMSVYEELAGLDYFSARTSKVSQDDESEDNMPISELIKVRSQQAKRPALADVQQGWETSTQTPSVLSVGRATAAAAAARYYPPLWTMESYRIPNHRPWEGRPVYVPPGCQLKDLLPGGSEIVGPAPRPNPFKDQFDEMLSVLQRR